MRDQDLHRLRFPIGEFQGKPRLRSEELTACIDAIEALPNKLEAALDGLDDSQLDTAYREGGWTLRQVVHHLADSHINSWCRFRLTITEDVPTIRTYDEVAVAELPDAKSGPVGLSVDILIALHRKWALFLRAVSDDDWKRRRLNHPDHGEMRLDTLLDMYAWHGEHHVAHITSLRERMGW